MKANGLKLFSINSISKPLGEIEDVFQKTADLIKRSSFAIAYLDYEVRIGRFDDGQFAFYQTNDFDPKYLQKLRVFNQNEELYIWRSGGKLYGRYRVDGMGGNELEVVEAHQVLFGTRFEKSGDWTKLWEDRGTSLIVPGKYVVDKNRNRVAIETYNYIGYMNEGNLSQNQKTVVPRQAGYMDCRFVEFVQLHEKKGEKNND